MIKLPLVLSAVFIFLVPSIYGQESHTSSERPSGSSTADPNIPALLFKAIREQTSGHYEGRLTREFLHGPQNLKHDEIVFRDGPRTRIEFPEGSKYSGQIIVDNSSERLYYLPDKNEIYVLPSRREESFGRLAGLARRADAKRIFLSEAPGERIAGILTEQIIVRDRFNTITQRLFIDPKSGVVLRRQVFDAIGESKGYFQFNQINLRPGNFDASLFRLDRPGAKLITPVETLREVATKAGFDPLVFPSNTGYRLEQSRVATIEREKVLVETFGSRKGRLTLFELKNAVSPDRLKKVARGEVQVYSWQRGDKWYVLFGPRAEGELVQLAQVLQNGTP